MAAVRIMDNDEQPMTSFAFHSVESVKPIPVRTGNGSVARIGFALRRLVDLQLATCWRFLGPRLHMLEGDVLDVGCGESPYRRFLPPYARYTGLDVEEATGFGMTSRPEVHAFDGRHIPFEDQSFDHILCTEVLEHAEYPDALVAEMLRVLRPGGTILVTVPFSARVHHAPYDFHRFTPFRLRKLFASFHRVDIAPRGNDLAVIANKLIVLCMRSAHPSSWLVLRLPLLILTAPLAGLFLGIAHIAISFGWGSEDDPLGYAVAATKL